MEEIEQMKWFNEKYYFFNEKKKEILKIKSLKNFKEFLF
jgi:hypothetical protein